MFVWSLFGLAVFGAYEFVLGGFMYEQRQRHLAASYRKATPTVPTGGAFGVLQIPKTGTNAIVVEGDAHDALRSGPAHRPDKVAPGQPGTIVVLGRRSRYGGPFGTLSALGPNDPIYLQPKNAASAVEYRVVCRAVVDGPRSALLGPSTEARLALVTAADGLLPGQYLVVLASAGGSTSSTAAPAGTTPATSVPTSVASPNGVTPPAAASRGTCPGGTGTPVRLGPGAPLALVNWPTFLEVLCIAALVNLYRLVHRRYRRPVLVVVLGPLACLTLIFVAQSLDVVLPHLL